MADEQSAPLPRRRSEDDERFEWPPAEHEVATFHAGPTELLTASKKASRHRAKSSAARLSSEQRQVLEPPRDAVFDWPVRNEPAVIERAPYCSGERRDTASIVSPVRALWGRHNEARISAIVAGALLAVGILYIFDARPRSGHVPLAVRSSATIGYLAQDRPRLVQGDDERAPSIAIESSTGAPRSGRTTAARVEPPQGVNPPVRVQAKSGVMSPRGVVMPTETIAAAPRLDVPEAVEATVVDVESQRGPDAVAPRDGITPDIDHRDHRTASAASSVAAATPEVTATAGESAGIVGVIHQYERAYNQLDAGAAEAIWPSLDTRALANAFARLRQQDLKLDQCMLVVSENRATARCVGNLRYVRRVGDATPQRERHAWTIQLQRVGERWNIVDVSAR